VNIGHEVTSLIVMFSIAPVPFLESGLEGFLTPHAVQIHVTKHHQAYVDNANKLVPASPFAGKTMEEILQQSDGGIFNNVAQHFNHSFFWNCLSNEKPQMTPAVHAFLEKNFESFDKFKEQFVQKASTVFGSGWCFLTKTAENKIEIRQYSNALNPIKEHGFPILCVDTWEHAWYIDYENRKAEYFAKFWNYVNWNFVESRLREAHLL